MPIESDLLPLVGRIYDAVRDPSLWQAFLAAFTAALGADAAAFHQHQFDQRSSEIGAVFGQRAGVRSPPNAARGRMGILHGTGRPLHPQGPVLFDEGICSRPTRQETAFYNDFLVPLGGRYGASGVIDRIAGGTATITALRGPDRRQWDAADLELMRLLLPHLARARHIEERVNFMTAGTVALNGLDIGVLLVSRPSHLDFANYVAEAMLQKGDGLTTRDGVLRASDGASDRRLRRAVRDATEVQSLPNRTAAVSIRRDSTGRAYQVVASSLVRSTSAFAAPSSPQAMLVIVDPERRRTVPPETLASLYDLTRREAELTSHISAGTTMQAAARALGMTYETARSHLGHIFEKTGTSRQTELVVLLARLPMREV